MAPVLSAHITSLLSVIAHGGVDRYDRYDRRVKDTRKDAEQLRNLIFGRTTR